MFIEARRCGGEWYLLECHRRRLVLSWEYEFPAMCMVLVMIDYSRISISTTWRHSPTQLTCSSQHVSTDMLPPTWPYRPLEMPTKVSWTHRRIDHIFNHCSVNKEARYLTQNKQLHNVTSHDASKKILMRSRDRVDEMVVDQLSRVDGGRPDQSGRWPSVLVGVI